MAANPLVSICIPTFNGERYLKECLDSCLSQTFKDFEIVICDDGSTDGTVTVIKEYIKDNSVIRFFENDQNLGMVGNWNNCINKSRGEWIKFVFQDDYLSSDCLSIFTSQAAANVNLIVSKRNFILNDHSDPEHVNYYAKDLRTLDNVSVHKGPYFSPELLSAIAVENICMNFIGEPSLIFFRKNMVNELGYFTDSLKQICDLEFVLRIGTSYGLIYIPEKICAFRVHNESATSTNIQNKYFEMRYVEPVIFTWHLLYHDHFQKFRGYLSLLKKFKLTLYFKTKVYAGNLISIREAKNHDLYNETKTGFKEVNRYKKGNLFVKLIANFLLSKY